MIELPTISPDIIVGEISLNTQEVTPKDSIHFTCNSRADCCSNMNIPVTDFDINRIAAHGYELDQIVRELSPSVIDSGTSPNGKQLAYFLKSKPYDKTCTFLENNLCTIHEFKPFACKIYPFVLDIREENHIVIKINEYQICKSIKAVDPEYSNNNELLHNILKMFMEEITARDMFSTQKA